MASDVTAGSEDTYYFLGEHYPRADAERDFAPVLRRVLKDLDAAPFPTTLRDFTPAAHVLDHMSVLD